ncbi:uncharacterized protein LOC108622497 [Ceratina calcarata]|uniref:Uncharacterized protein LOC108622497 n=1 Tax=Ceratina calcarata TaxID=156304 RepID=A0AAJ7N3I8_9HYME|nr:uncharacterized protein LOC108622497 [Ceratina calcarata]
MKKSPLSTPSGSKIRQNYSWKSRDYKNRTGYHYANNKSDSYQYSASNGSQACQSGNDFIPLSISSPLPEQKRLNDSWHNSGGGYRNSSGSGAFNHYRNSYHSTPKSNFNNSYSPYKLSGKQFYGQKKGYHKDPRKQVNISNYIDMRSFLEDPWAELTEKLNKSKETDEDESLEIDSKALSNLDSSCLSPESKLESSIDVTLGLDDTDISDISRTESSIDLKLDSVKVSQESKDDSSSSVNSEDANNETNVSDICSGTSIIRDLA